MSTAATRVIQGQPSWELRASHVTAYLTRTGGHLAPVRFRLGRRTVMPFSVAPWANERLGPEIPALLRVLRGDFFCAPFGGNARPWRGERHPPHGESANAVWRLRGIEKLDGKTRLRAEQRSRIRGGLLEKEITLVDGHTAIYQRHTFRGWSGPLCVGHHATLRFPDEPGSGLISTSRFVHGQIYPGEFERPEAAGYQSLRPGAKFRSLDRVPLLAGGHADLSRYPARAGYEDLVMITADAGLPFAWTAVAFPREGFAWFSLRDPRVLRHTVFWISNGGRHYAPWNGRHRCVMGLEDVTSHFHDGLAESAGANGLNRAGYPTVLRLSPSRPTEIRYVMAVAPIPAGFGRVAAIEPAPDGVELVGTGEKRARCALNLAFLAP